METALFIFYLLAFVYLTSTIRFFKLEGLPKWTVPFLFIIKIAAGIAYALFYKLPQYYVGSDTWRFFRLSLLEKKWLLSDPLGFIKDLFVHGYSKSGNIFSGENSYWNDLKSNILVKLMAVMNIATNDSYYTNIILFNFLFLVGLVALYKVASALFTCNKWLLIAGIFLLPSTLFWCSGIHKDGLILSATGIIIYWFYKSLIDRFTPIRSIGILLLLALIFFLRNYVALALMPALFCWWLSSIYPARKFLIFAGIYLIGIIAFFSLPLIITAADLPAFIVSKHEEFSQLPGGSEVAISELQPNLKSFIIYLPMALDIAFLRPHINEIKNLSYLPAVAEIVLFILLLLIAAINYRRITLSPTGLFLIFYGISIMLIAGYTITLSGAIVRYRSYALPFLLLPLIDGITTRYLNYKK